APEAWAVLLLPASTCARASLPLTAAATAELLLPAPVIALALEPLSALAAARLLFSAPAKALDERADAATARLPLTASESQSIELPKTWIPSTLRHGPCAPAGAELTAPSTPRAAAITPPLLPRRDAYPTAISSCPQNLPMHLASPSAQRAWTLSVYS